MSVQITDCTIRDGGYLLDKNSDSEFVKGIMEGLAKAGIDFACNNFSTVNSNTIIKNHVNFNGMTVQGS